jgi:hypothetical protein|tara:strand:+ start:13407 stop:15086 length:1680 start_codon:yes stop_codon:yes gene_type:complete
MSNYINEALLGASQYKEQRVVAKQLVEKWDRTGLLDGLDGDFKRGGMAQLLENQARELIKEASVTSPSAGAAGAYKGDEEWSGVALPLVRRIFGEIAAQEFVSVQPMNLPSGLVFYLDFQYGSNRGGMGKDSSLMGKTGKYSPSGSNAPYGDDSYGGGFYGAGRYGYSMATGSESAGSITTTLATWKDVNFNTELSSSVNAGKIFKCVEALAATDIDKSAIRATNFVSGAIGQDLPHGAGMGGSNHVNRFFPELTSISGEDYAAGTITFFLSASAAVNIDNSTIEVQYPKLTSEAARGDFEDVGGDASKDSLQIPQVDIELKSRAIVAKTRKLKAVWTPELAQDLNAYHSVDGEAELTAMLTEYVSMEIDLEILDMLISDAQTVDYWSVRQGNDYDGSGAFTNTTFYGTRFEWYQTLVGKIQKVSNEIHKLTLRGGANFVVCGPQVATILESIPGYMTDTDGDQNSFAMGVQKMGALTNRFTVYKNPYMDENTILLGYRGSNFLETGAVYAPYVPLIMTPLVYDPNDFTPRKGVMTRYAKKMIRPEFYGKIYVDALDQL